jgi:hypothetical protein
MTGHTPSPRSRWIAILLILASAVPAGATTMVHQSLDRLTAANEVIVQARVIESRSYWSDQMILTDVRLQPAQILKGQISRANAPVTITLVGGTVGQTTVLQIGMPVLEPGRDYILFLNREMLTARETRLTVRDLAQGVFEIDASGPKLRAVSQARGHPLLPSPDRADETVDVPGGEQGFALDELVTQVRTLAHKR